MSVHQAFYRARCGSFAFKGSAAYQNLAERNLKSLNNALLEGSLGQLLRLFRTAKALLTIFGGAINAKVCQNFTRD